MKKSVSLVAILALAACGGDGSPSGNGNLRSNYHGRDQIGAFPNVAVESNNNITRVMSRTDAQRADFVKYRLILNGYDNVPTQESELLAIANAAFGVAEFASGTKSAMPENNEKLRPALFVFSKDMGACATATDIAKCVNDLKSTSDFSNRVKQVYANTEANLTADKLNFKRNDGSDAKFTFIIDDASGKITGVKLDDTTTYARDKNVFKNGDKTLTYVSGMDALSPLMYSDFGKYTITDGTTTSAQLFYAGYDDKKIKADDIVFTGAETTAVFKGRAVGTVENATTSQDLNGRAELMVSTSDKSGQLNAFFDNWYDVTVNTNNKISFDNFQGDAAYKFATSGDGAAHSGATFNVEYYGMDKKEATEAVGGAKYDEGDIKFNMAFGVKKQ